MTDCRHTLFRAYVEIILIGGAYKGEIKVRCAECDLPFNFDGVEVGKFTISPSILDADEPIIVHT